MGGAGLHDGVFDDGDEERALVAKAAPDVGDYTHLRDAVVARWLLAHLATGLAGGFEEQ